MARFYERRHRVDSFWFRRLSGRRTGAVIPGGGGCPILLETGEELWLETGEAFMLEGCGDVVTECPILLETGEELWLETDEAFMLEGCDGVTPSGSFIQNEDGFYLLLEDGGRLALEG